MTIQEIFKKAQNGTFTWEQFETEMKNANAKFVDLNEGAYVSKNKYDSDLEAKDNQIRTLNDTIKQRDTDLTDLQTKLTEAGTDATKLSELTTNLATLQSKYDDDTKAYKAQLKQQAYEFAVREFAGTKKFTSNAAKRDFVQSMIAKKLQMENNSILGADDFVKSYSENNSDAFVVEEEHDNNQQQQNNPLPQFVAPTGNQQQVPDNNFVSAFHFTGVRQRPGDNK